ncbi:MAG: hypothetical protein AAF639_47520, partial [Chloroflexota bacterium]
TLTKASKDLYSDNYYLLYFYKIMVAIQVFTSFGESIPDADVYISWSDGLTHSQGKTDSRGVVSFNVPPGSGEIFVNGRIVYRGPIGEELVVST